MTLLTALRKHPDVKKATPATLRTTYDVPVKRPFTAKQLLARDRALVTACLQEAAKRVKQSAENNEGDHQYSGLVEAADLIDQMAKESAK